MRIFFSEHGLDSKLAEKTPSEHLVQIYYEDTDHSGVVYHPNYLKYAERGREHLLGVQKLVELGEQGLGFVVYWTAMSFKKGAVFGDELVVRTWARAESEHRLRFWQRFSLAAKPEQAYVGIVLDMVCVNAEQGLVSIPPSVRDELSRLYF